MDREKVAKGLECCCTHIVGMSCGNCPYEIEQREDEGISDCTSVLAYDALALINEQKETIQITKNVAERYGNILADKGVNGVWVRYAVKKGKHFMAEYQNKKASWCYGLDGAWMSFDREMAEGFAKLTKGKLIEVTLTERPLND
ncbi:MAG: hypothetical protein IKG23_00545 [Clostridia bacterium]|nr:hypothetical protein [Clostridia bacterium]